MKKKPTTFWESTFKKVAVVVFVLFLAIQYLALKLTFPGLELSIPAAAIVTGVAVGLLFGIHNWRKAKSRRIVKEGFTELMYFSANGKKWDVIDQLNAGASPDTQDVVGGTALIYAAKNGQEDVVRVLLERGANPTIKTNAGKIASDFARSEGYMEIADMLDSVAKDKTSLSE